MKKIMTCFLLLVQGWVSAAIFNVNLTVQDHIDDDPGDGVCDIAAGGFCTLRAAIMEANALPGPDIIVLPGNATIRLSIPGTDENASATGDLDITDAIAIGAFTEDTEDFPTIDAADISDRAFHVLNSSGVVTFVNFRVINGSSNFSNGGAVLISTNNQVEMNRLWFEDNTADSGGAVFVNAFSEVNIIDSVFKGNAAVSQGGAITTFSNTEIIQTTVFENLNFNADFQEAIYVGSSGFGVPQLNIRNSTLFDNSATAVYAQAADLSIRNSTIVQHPFRGVVSNPNDSVTPELRIRNSLFDQNLLNCAAGGAVDLVSNNYNISSDNSNCFQGGNTNMTEIEPQLTAVKADEEDWHRYFRPGFYSPAIDSAHPAAPGPGIGCEGEDQLGVSRPQDSYGDGNDRCDVGAIELSEDIIFFDGVDFSFD